ncbi:MAG: hypothetical protein OXG65_16445 [Chloroflexi bacterium]|nr:hypothetical protein [Chloroflexota bacterium]
MSDSDGRDRSLVHDASQTDEHYDVKVADVTPDEVAEAKRFLERHSALWDGIDLSKPLTVEDAILVGARNDGQAE